MASHHLENFECVRTWIESVLARGTGSPGTREVYLDRLNYFLKFAKLDPDGLIALARAEPAKVKALLNRMIIEWERAGRSRQYTSSTFRTAISFLKENDVILNVRGPKVFTRKPKRAVTVQEINRFMQFAPLRMKAFAACMKDCGMAPIDVMDLRYGDVREGLESKKIPINIKRVRHKTRTEFETFLGPDAVEYLGYYLDARRTGTSKVPPEELKDESPLFAAKGEALTYDALKSQHWRISKGAGTGWQLYDLRKFFSTNLKASGMNETVVEYLMGHKLASSIDPYFYRPENLEKIYMDHYSHLSLKPQVIDEKKLRKQQLLDTARLIPGISEESLQKIREAIEARDFGEDLIDEVKGLVSANGTKGPARKRPAPKAARRSKPRKQRHNRDPGDPPIGCG